MAASTSPIWSAEAAPGVGRLGRALAGDPVAIAFGPAALAELENAAGSNLDYWRGFIQFGPSAFAPNFKTRAGVVRCGLRHWPLTLNDRRAGNSYPCSLSTQYVAYPKAELGLVPAAWQRRVAGVGLTVLDGLLRIAQADRVVQWSSWLLSTNLHGPGLPDDIPAVTRAVASAFPQHAILVKNIHGFEDSGLPVAFVNAGYELVTSRQIYFFDGRTRDYAQKSTVKRDAKALAQLQGYRAVEHDQFTMEDIPRITELYRKLYVDKHSSLNPQYTRDFVRRAWRERWLEFRGLRNESGRLDAVFACFTSGTTTSTPFIGYDTDLPSELGLYRHLVSQLLQRLGERRWLLNYSSGAGDFKRRRGGQPVIEFNAIFSGHLSAPRRAAFRALAGLANRWGRRFLEENEI